MLDCGKPNFLNEFVVCLKVSNDGTGDAHRELAETIEKAYKSEMERSVSPEIGILEKSLLFNRRSLDSWVIISAYSFYAGGMSVTVVHGAGGSRPHHLFTGGKLLPLTHNSLHS